MDCSGTAPDARSVQRAWRRMALTSHPDKTDGGSSEAFEDMTKLRDSLKDPDKFQIHRLLHGLAELRPFDSRAPELRVTTASLTVRQQCTDLLDKATCFPYAVLSSEFALSKVLPPGATWKFALGAKDVSTIQYHGDEEAGGYDACCDLRKDSACVRRAAEATPALGDGGGANDRSSEGYCSPDAAAAGQCEDDRGSAGGGGGGADGGGDGSSGGGGGGGEGHRTERGADMVKPPKGVVYESHDCPMGDVFTTEVSRPLHVMAAGQWAATLSIRSAEGVELACVAAAMTVHEGDLKRADANVTEAGGSTGEDAEQSQQGGRGSEDPGSAGHSEGAGAGAGAESAAGGDGACSMQRLIVHEVASAPLEQIRSIGFILIPRQAKDVKQSRERF